LTLSGFGDEVELPKLGVKDNDRDGYSILDELYFYAFGQLFASFAQPPFPCFEVLFYLA
jgi:hypothetical protein